MKPGRALPLLALLGAFALAAPGLAAADSAEAPSLRKIKTLATDASPKSCLASPDGKTVYSLNLEGMSIEAWDADTKALRWRIKFHPTPATGWDYDTNKPIKSFAEKPVEAALTEGGRYLWVSLHNGASVVVVDTRLESFPGDDVLKATLTVSGEDGPRDLLLKRIPVGRTPKVIAVTPDESTVYVANWHSHSISVIDARSFTPVKEIAVSAIPRGLALSADGKTLWVAIMGGDQLAKIDVATQELLGYVRIGRNPRHVVLSADGKSLFVSLNGPGDVVQYSPADDRVIAKVHVGQQPRTLGLSPDGRHLFVVEYKDNRMAVIDAQTLAVEGQYPTGDSPVGVTLTPDGREAWVVNYRSSTIDVFAVEGMAVPAASPDLSAILEADPLAPPPVP
jgi:YVTN family beta-propeller protein